MKTTSLSLLHGVGSAQFALRVLAGSLLLIYGGASLAAPVGGAVSAGSASIVATPGVTTINQSSQNAAINWQGFSIGAAEAVRFVQPGSSSIALNRVLGADPSSILGTLSANGKVFLVNPNGILFGSGAQVNVGGLVASTRNITDSDFMAGRLRFSGSGAGTVVNQGSINAEGGYVALLGASVSNEGTISARFGTVALASGNAMTLDVAGDGLLNVAISEGTANALAQNTGLVRADGGLVTMSARSAGGLFEAVVNNTGIVQARSIDTRNGAIRLAGDIDAGTVNVGGSLDVSGAGAGQSGGTVVITGHHVGLFGGKINASGDAGGGTVLIGGDYQGANAGVPNASATYMSPDAVITADAITSGTGGKVVLWSNDSTRASGSISAKGGARGGDGGLIETSGHFLDVAGLRIDASAQNGNPGTWLLDPADVTISSAATSNDTETVSPANSVFTPNPGQGAANINDAALLALLNGGTNVTITTTNTGAAGIPASGRGDITLVADPVAFAWTRTAAQTKTTLTLNAAGDVNINRKIVATGGNLVVCCGRDINLAAIVAPEVGPRITLTNGSGLLSAGRDINVNGAVTVTDGNFAMCAGRDIHVTAAMTMTNGTTVAAESLANLGVRQGLTFSAGTAATGPGVAGGGGLVDLQPPGGTITVTQGGAPGTAAPVFISYNPLAYGTPVTSFTGNFTAGTPITVQRLVFPDGATKVFDGTTNAVFTSLKADSVGVLPAGVTLVAGPGATTAAFDTPDVGVAKTVTFSGFTLGGASASAFALPAACCGPIVGHTSANITPAVAVVPVIVPPVVVPGVVAPGVVPGVAEGVVPEVVLPVFVAGRMLESAPFLQHSPVVDLSVTGVNIPQAALVEVVAPPVLLAPRVVPPPEVIAPPPYVPPVFPPRKDRN